MYFFAVCFGVSSWVTINGIFSVLPLMIHRVPEGWVIASTLVLSVQAANIGPLVYRLIRSSHKSIAATVYGILALGSSSMLLLAYFWDVTIDISGKPCSVMLIACTFTAALCDCTSSVVFWPFAGALSPAMAAGLALGESLSGVTASVVTWLGFSPRGSFSTLALVLLISGMAFYKLQLRALRASPTTLEAKDHLVRGHTQSPQLPYLIVGLMSLLENAVLPSVLPYATARYSPKASCISETSWGLPHCVNVASWALGVIYPCLCPGIAQNCGLAVHHRNLYRCPDCADRSWRRRHWWFSDYYYCGDRKGLDGIQQSSIHAPPESWIGPI